jgi:hypothetical protein
MDIVQMVREAAQCLPGYSPRMDDPSGAVLEFYTEFAVLVAAYEREKCAKLCDALAIDHGRFAPDEEEFKAGVLASAAVCAATIRLRRTSHELL